MHNVEIQARVRRIIRGDSQPADFEKTLSFLRFKCHKYRELRDLADFIDHQTARTQGGAWQRVHDTLTVQNYHLPQIMRHPEPRQSYSIEKVKEVGLATIRLMNGKDPTSAWLSPDRFLKALRKVKGFDGPRAIPHPTMTVADGAIIEKAISVLASIPVLTISELYDEFFKVLLLNKFVSQSDREPFDNQINSFSIFVLAALHGQVIDTKYGDGLLRIHVSQNVTLECALVTREQVHGLETGVLTSAIFTDLDASKWCSTDLLQRIVEANSDDQLPAVEIDNEWRLALLQ